MDFLSIRSGTREELELNKYNIGVGISLGNKWFNPENILSLVRWSLTYTREKVVVYVADSIHSLNIEARTGKSPKKAKELSLQQGQNILNEVRNQINGSFSKEELSRISYAHWDELVDDRYRENVNYLYNLFNTNNGFKKAILNLVENHISKESRAFSNESMEKMACYILEELPEILCRVKIAGTVCDAYVYPFDGELCVFAQQLQNGEIFPEIKEVIITTEPKVFLEVR
jgi:tRNA-dependent cyclodipeptide synthase